MKRHVGTGQFDDLPLRPVRQRQLEPAPAEQARGLPGSRDTLTFSVPGSAGDRRLSL